MYQVISYFFMILLFSFNLAIGHFWQEKARGWHWYENKKHFKKAPKSKKNINKEEKSLKTAKSELEKIKVVLEEKLATAILNPSIQNIFEFQKEQKKLADRAELFSRNWALSLLKNPEVDETIKNPVSLAGIQFMRNEMLMKKEQIINNGSKKYSLFVFYEGKASVSQAFLDSIASFENRYKWNIMAITVDNTKLSEETVEDNGIVESWGIKAFPAIFLVDTESEWYTEAGFGILSSKNIVDNISMKIKQREEEKIED